MVVDMELLDNGVPARRVKTSARLQAAMVSLQSLLVGLILVSHKLKEVRF